MEDVLKNLVLWLPFASGVIFLIVVISNQVFNLEIEPQLYSNFEKFIIQVMIVLGIGLILLLMLYLASSPEKIDPETMSKSGTFVFATVVLLVISLYFYLIYRVGAYLTPKPSYYFKYNDTDYVIIKRHRKNVWLCHNEESGIWMFFTEEYMFNQTEIYKAPMDDAYKKLAMKLYKKNEDINSAIKILFVTGVVILCIYCGALLYFIIVLPMINHVKVDWGYAWFILIFWASTMAMVLPMMATYRYGEKLTKEKKEKALTL
ncbi:hypothetical protein HB815_01585 [Listeria booriae]|uniref:hypothetical protein n=1 Tax=Listeria booriae TaxID=1552123 RepID=UPI001626C24B|nr:hypothetical protein [Listeria booriae]MBC1209607.1 hypothetical protein [Listeria booriae]